MSMTQKGPMNKVCPSFYQEVILELGLFIFFLELNMVWGAHVVLCMTRAGFFENIFAP